MTDRFQPGDRVVHITVSAIPEGVEGTVLGRAPTPFNQFWEVEYDGHPCIEYSREILVSGSKSKTSWFSRDSSIELTREEALKRVNQRAAIGG